MNLTFEELKEKLLATEAFIDNEYLDQYCELIIQNKNQKKIKYQTQGHHILPKCYFAFNNLKVDDSKENLVNLLYKDHILVHYYICLCINGVLQYKLAHAFFILVSRKWKYSEFNPETDLSEYQRLYENYCRNVSEDKERYQKLSKALKGKKQSKETCEKKRIAKIGFSHTEESKKLMHDIKMAIPKERFDTIYKSISEQRKGCVWMYDNASDKYKMVHRDKVEEFLNNGWVKQAPAHSKESHQRAAEKKKLKKRNTQQKENHSIGHKGKIFINKEEECIMIYPEELEKYLSLGWVKGRLSRK